MNNTVKLESLNNTIKNKISNDNSNQAVSFTSAKSQAKGLRGELIDSFCRIENSISHILLKLSHVSEYKTITKQIQPQFGNLLVSIIQTINSDGKYKTEISKLSQTFENLKSLINVRNNLAHGRIEVLLNENNEFVFVFETIKIDGDKSQILKSHYSITELKSCIQKLNSNFQKIESLSKKIV